MPETGPVIIAGNHPSYLDPLLIALPLKRVIRFMAWDALFKVPVLGLIIKKLGAFPVELGRGKGEAAYREALRVLEGGAALGIFPEGKRSDLGPMGDLKAGAARLAIETGAPIVPVTIGGASRAWPKWRLLPKPAKIVVRYHRPIRLEETDRDLRRQDRGFQREVIENVRASINRSLTPALREAENFEKWYRQPPSHIRLYEWAPLVVALAATLIARGRGSAGEHWARIWAAPVAYYLYLIVDLSLIRPGRAAKWLRNSMPIWLILVWHYPLTEALGVTGGEMNWLVAGAALAAFFPFFWEDYYTLQKFVRGVVVVYYASLALLLQWPHGLGQLVAMLLFIAAFSFWYRTRYRLPTIAVMALSILAVFLSRGRLSLALLIYAALALAAVAYLQVFISAAYDIRKAGIVSVKGGRGKKRLEKK